MAKVVLKDGAVTREYMIAGEVSIGRLPENTIQLTEAGVSRKHARLMAEGQDVIVEDLGSAGGTQVNGVAVKKQVLRHGDVISIGKVRLSFVGEQPPTSDPLFEKTLVGQDPLFAPTLMGPPPSAPVSALPPPPPPLPPPVAAPPAASAASVPASVSMPRPQIILPRKSMVNAFRSRRGLQLLAVSLILLAAAALFLPDLMAPHMVNVDWAPVEGLAKESRWADVAQKLTEIEGLALSDTDRVKIQSWKQRVAGEAEVREIESLIFEKGEFADAYQRAQAAGNKFTSLGNRFVDLSKQAFTASFVMESAATVAKADENADRSVLTRVVETCRQVGSRCEEQKAVLARLPAVVQAYRTCIDRREVLEKRMEQLDAAEGLWTRIQEARQTQQWARELQALGALAALPAAVSSRVGDNVPVEVLQKNAAHFVNGLAEHQKGDFAAAAQAFSAVDASDFHAAVARNLLEEMRQAGGYGVALKLYREGKGGEALKALQNTDSEKARKLRERVGTVVAGYGKLVALRDRKALDELVASGEAFLTALSAEADGYYHAQTTELVLAARGQRYEQRVAELEQLVQQKKYGDALQRCAPLLAGMDQASYPELFRRVTVLREGVLQTIQKDVGQWVKTSEDFWTQYQKNPIVSEERTATQGVPETYRRKADLLRRSFEQISQVQGAIQILPAEKAKPVSDLYEAVRQEIVLQAEKIFNVRTQYSQLGNFKLTKQAEEMILLLGDTPGNPYYGMVSGKKE